MRWITYFILAYVMVGIQAGLSGVIDVWAARPDLALICVVFIAMNAPRDAALLGAFVLGGMQDLMTVQPLGLHAIAYSLAAMFTFSAAPIVHRTHPLSHFSLCFVGSILVAGAMLLHSTIYKSGPPVTVLFYGALFTGIVAVPVLGVLQRIRKIFAFQKRTGGSRQ